MGDVLVGSARAKLAGSSSDGRLAGSREGALKLVPSTCSPSRSRAAPASCPNSQELNASTAANPPLRARSSRRTLRSPQMVRTAISNGRKHHVPTKGHGFISAGRGDCLFL